MSPTLGETINPGVSGKIVWKTKNQMVKGVTRAGVTSSKTNVRDSRQAGEEKGK